MSDHEAKLNLPSTSQSVSVDKAPTTPRPFSNVPNFYEHACSVLCNHPLGPRLSWFARRFVWATNVFRNQALNRARVVPLNLLQTGQPPNGSDVLVPDEHSDYWLYSSFTPVLGNIVSPSLQQRRRFMQLPPISRTEAQRRQPIDEPPINKVDSSLYETFPDSGKRSAKSNYTKVKEMRHAHFPLAKKQGKGKKGLARKKSGKKSKKHSKSVKKGDSDDLRESGDDDLPDGGSPKQGRKERKRKSNLKEFPVTREEVENPFTLVEGESSSSGPTRRRSHRNRDGLVGADGKSASTEGGEWTDDATSGLQKQLDDEVEGSEFDPKRLQELQNVLQAEEIDTKRTSTAAKEMQAISEEISRKSIRSDAWLHYPRIPCRHSCRFELPMDAKILIHLSPADYLSTYCKVPRKRRQLFFKIFTKYRGVESNVAMENIPKAMGDIFGQPIPESSLKPIFVVAGVDTVSKVEFSTFAGLAALTERFLSKEVMMDSEQYKDTVEELDFKDLSVYVEGIRINESVHELLQCIQAT